MTAALLRPYPLLAERVQLGTGLLVIAAHVGLLWVANLYWPLQSVLLGAVQSVTVQIFQADVKRSATAAADADNALPKTNPQTISDGRQPDPAKHAVGRHGKGCTNNPCQNSFHCISL